MSTKELSISVPVAERTYRLVVGKEHEELFRKAARLIDQRIRDYSVSYAYKDKQDLLAMVALEYATSYLRNEQRLTESGAAWEEKLAALDEVLSANLRD